MKKIILLTLMFLILLVGCTQNQFSNEIEINVKILKVTDQYLSINYKIGNEEIFDDIVLQAEAQKFMLGKVKNIQLKLVTTGLDHDNKQTSTAKYYYGINYIGPSKIFKDYGTLLRLAQKNPSLFIWVTKDGNFVNEDKKKKEEVKVGEEVKKL